MVNLYCYENKITGKIYIGQTKLTLKERAGADYINYKQSKKFYNAIKKYGCNNFYSTIFKIVETQDEANQEEMFWIAEMRRLLGENMIYNITDGGNKTNSVKSKFTDEQKNNMKIQFLQGTALVKIAKQFKCSPALVFKIVGKRAAGFQSIRLKGNKYAVGTKSNKIFAGKTWKLIDGKRVWL